MPRTRTISFFFFFWLEDLGQQKCWQRQKTWKPSGVENPSMILGDPHAWKAGRHNRGTEEHGKTQSQWTPSQHPFLSLEDGGAVESDRPQKSHSGSRGRFWIHSLIHQKASDWIGSPWFGGTETKAAAISTLTVRRQWKWMSTWAYEIVLNWTLYCLCQHCHQQ